jgi:predicted RNase H-like nuclease (RuvC/YqgF family)
MEQIRALKDKIL